MEYTYIGNCTNSFNKKDGTAKNEFIPYRDVSEFACQWEDILDEETGDNEISKRDFFTYVDINQFKQIIKDESINKIKYYFDNKYSLLIAYDITNDIHYFFIKG